MKALVITVSTRAAAGVYEDRSGPILVAGLRDLGFDVAEPTVIPDGESVEKALRTALAEGYDVVLTTGGTGLSPSDVTPDMTRRVLDADVPGIADALRTYGVAHGVPGAMLSRGVSGRAGDTLIVNLPGSTGGVRDGLAVLSPVLGHAVEQIAGGSHDADSSSSARRGRSMSDLDDTAEGSTRRSSR